MTISRLIFPGIMLAAFVGLYQFWWSPHSAVGLAPTDVSNESVQGPVALAIWFAGVSINENKV